MHTFVRNLITEWRKLGLPAEGETIIVAVSGGADSMSLLMALSELQERKKLELRIVAAHFNHKLRARESEEDEEFVKHVTAENDIELAVGRGPISKDGNLEQNARRARYEFLLSTAENLKAGRVMTAHTMNDQAETFLLNLIRGSGVDGLSGMQPVRALNAESRSGSVGPGSPIFLVRPILRWASREDTENFCRGSGVDYRYDSMNEDMSFKRVRVRKMLLPMLKEFNPKIIETLARTAELMQTTSEPHRPAGGRELDEHSRQIPEELLIDWLKDLDTADVYLTIRTWLKNRRGSLRSVGVKHIQAIERLIRSTKSGRTVEIPGFGVVRKHGGRLVYENIKVDK